MFDKKIIHAWEILQVTNTLAYHGRVNSDVNVL